MPKKIKHALVLSGGGFKAAFQIGALDYLRENNLIDPDLKFNIISGISAGSLNGAMIAAGQYDKLKEIWERIETEGYKVIYTSDFINEQGEPEINSELIKSIFFPNYRLQIGFFKGLGLLLSKRKQEKFLIESLNQLAQEVRVNFNQFKAVASNDPLENVLAQYLYADQIPADTIFTCGFVSLVDGQYYHPRHTDFPSNEEFRKGVLASTTLPIIWEPVPEVRTQQQVVKNLLDGGLKNSSPLGDVIKLIEQDKEEAIYKIIIINNNSGKLEPEREEMNLARIALRALTEITLTEIFNNDIREFIRINDLVVQAQRQGVILRNEKGRPLKHFYYKIIQPQGQELGETLDARREQIQKRYEIGRQRAMEVFSQVGEPHWPDEPVL